MITVNELLKKRIKEKAEIRVFVPRHWQEANIWSSVPREIVAQFKEGIYNISEVKIMSCYMSKFDNVIQVTTLKPAGVFKDNKKEDKIVMDAYMNAVLKSLITHASVLSVKRLTVQSLEMPYIFDHLIDCGFQIKKDIIKYGGVYEF
jgi:hypothetical protein